MAATVDQRLERIEQILRDEPNLIHSNDGEFRERLDTLEKLKHQVKVTLRLREFEIIHRLFSRII